MIITANGKNVYIDEMEEMILENEKIKRVKVYEEHHHVAAEIISNLSEEEVRTYIEELNKNLPGYKKIKELHIRQDVLGGRFK